MATNTSPPHPISCQACKRPMPPVCLYCANCGTRLRQGFAPDALLGNKFQVVSALTTNNPHIQTYLAVEPRSNRQVVLKELRDDLQPPEQRQGVMQHLKDWSALRLPGLPTILGAVPHGGRTYLILDYIKGQTLLECLMRDGSLSPAKAKLLLRAAVTNLAQLHEKGPEWIHQALEPRHILITEDANVVFLDGAYLRRLGNRHQRAPLYDPRYAAPETLRGHLVPGADYYALALVILEAISGKPLATLYQPGSGTYDVAQCTDTSLADLLKWMLALRPSNRAGTADVILEALPVHSPEQKTIPVPPAPPAAAKAPSSPAVVAETPSPSPPPPPPASPPKPERGSPKILERLDQVQTIDDISTDEGLEALMALYAAQNDVNSLN